MRKEPAHIRKIEVPAFLLEGEKAVFYVDLVKSGRVHVVSEFVNVEGKHYRTSAWLGEDDSISWREK